MTNDHFLILFIIGFMILFFKIIEPLLIVGKLRNNNEYGSAKWASKKEIKKKFHVEKISNIIQCGFPVYYSKNNKKVWFDLITPHWIYLGSTGSGKSVTAVIPQCSFIATAKTKKSVFITDPKGEIFEKTSKMFENNGYKILTLDFRNPSLSNHLNILEPIIQEYELYYEFELKSKNVDNNNDKVKFQNESIKHFAECNQLINSLSTIIMYDKTAKEAFWNNSASDLLYGIISLFLEDYKDGKIKREQITLSSIKKFQNSSMTEVNHKKLKKYLNLKEYGLKSKDKLLPIISTNENTYKSITSIFNERMAIFDDINVENITSNSDFEFDIFGKEPTALFCCIPDETKIYYSLISITVSLIYKKLVLLCNQNKNKRLNYDLVFLLDEFANTPPLLDIETMVSVARSRGISFQFFVQSFAQLDNLYGREVSQIIQDNCGLAYLKTNTQETAESISKRLGNQTIKSSSLNFSIGSGNSSSYGNNLMARNLMTADEIKQLHYKTIIFPTNAHPIIRNTILYNKFSCYEDGVVDREERSLIKDNSKYYTVENLKLDDNTTPIKIEKQDLNNINDERTRLNNVIQEVLKIFNKIDFDIEYIKDGDITRADLFLAPPLSTLDILKLEELTQKFDFYYTAITIKEKINRKNRNSKLEITLNS